MSTKAYTADHELARGKAGRRRPRRALSSAATCGYMIPDIIRIPNKRLIKSTTRNGVSVMSDPFNLKTIQALAEQCNRQPAFQRAAEWGDVKIVLAIGETRFWLKLYRGRVIDVMAYLPASNPLGYDVIISGQTEAWRELLNSKTKSWAQLASGKIVIDGNLIEANRMHEALCILLESFAVLGQEKSHVA